MARRPDETPEPTHRNSEPGRVIIARTGDDGNRKQAGNFTPLPPAMKLLQIIRSHQPDEAPLGVAADQRADRIDGKPRAEIELDRGRASGRAAGGVSCRTQIGRAHVGTPVTNAQLVCRRLLEKKNYRNK